MMVDLSRIEFVRHESGAGAWELFRCRPDAALAPYVCEYHGYRETTAVTVRRIEVAMPAAVLILNFGPRWRIGDGHAPDCLAPFGSFVAGLYSTYAISENTGPSHCLQINLTPLGARRVFGMPMRDLSERVVDAADALGIEGRALEAKLVEAAGWPQRFAIADRFLLRRLAAASPVAPFALQAMRRLTQTHGALAIGALATELDVSRKHLAIVFHREIGLPPKTFARLLRFHRAAGVLTARATPRFAEVAHECGYYDQAHLTADFQQFAGMTPAAFIRQRLPDGTGVLDVA